MTSPSPKTKWQLLGGIPLAQLDEFCQTINDLTQTTDKSALIEILKFAESPFLKEYSSDEAYGKNLAIKTIDNIALLLHAKQDLEIVKQACKGFISLYNIAENEVKDSNYYEQQVHPVSKQFCQSIIHESNLLAILLDSVNQNANCDEKCDMTSKKTTTSHQETDSPFCLDLRDKITQELKVIQMIVANHFTKVKKPLSTKIVANCFQASSSILAYSKSRIDSPNNKTRQCHLEMIATLVDILFHVLTDHSSSTPFVADPRNVDEEDQKKNDLINLQESMIDSLFSIFYHFAQKATSSKQRKRRNDLLMLFTIFVEQNPTYFVSSGIMDIISHLSLQPEFCRSISTSRTDLPYPLFTIKLTGSIEDFEFKKLTWLFINKIAAFPAALRCISDSRVLEVFFEFIDCNSRQLASPKNPWSTAQKDELQNLALDCLSNLTPILLEDFINCKGVGRIIEFLSGLLENGSCFGQEKDDQISKISSTLKVIRQIIVLDCEPINGEFVNQGLVQIILKELSNRMNIPAKEDLEIKKDLLFILAVLCEYSADRKNLLERNGVILFVKYLKLCINALHRSNRAAKVPNFEQILVVYVVDCIWACICGSLITEQIFIESQGIYLLLDALERAHIAIHPILLGTLCELSDNDQALNHIAEWKSSIDGSTNSLELFLNIWDESANENQAVMKKFDLPTPENSPTKNSNNSRPATNSRRSPSTVIDRIFESPEAKIFILCQKLFKIVPHFNDSLSKHHQITKLSVDNYLDQQILNSWETVDYRLKHEDKIEPVPCDAEFLKNVSNIKDNNSVTLANQKTQLAEEIKNEKISEEEAVYNDSQFAYYTIEARHRRWLKKLIMTSDHKVLAMEADVKTQQLIESRKLQVRDNNSEIVKHEMMLPLKHNTTNHSKVLALNQITGAL